MPSDSISELCRYVKSNHSTCYMQFNDRLLDGWLVIYLISVEIIIILLIVNKLISVICYRSIYRVNAWDSYCLAS